MAAMNQDNLNSMVKLINVEASNYVVGVESAVRDFLKTFNETWVSNAAQELATQIHETLDLLANNITTTFANKNDGIKTSVINYNMREKENLSYSGFSFSKPNTDLTLGAALPNGKRGVADNADLNSLNGPMNTLVAKVTDVLDKIIVDVQNADAFDKAEETALVDSVKRIQTGFVTSMEEIKIALSQRMGKEIADNEALDAANISNLSA